MKHILLGLALFASTAVAQSTPPPPDCGPIALDFAGGNGIAPLLPNPYLDNRSLQCNSWTVAYEADAGLTGYTVAFQSATGSATPGTFGAYTGNTVNSSPSFGTAALGLATYCGLATCTTGGTTVNTPWIRMRVTGATGSGNMHVVFYGYKTGYTGGSAKGGGGGGGGGSGTVTNVASACSLAGGPITTTGTLSQAEPINIQTGTSYTFLSGDCGKLMTQSNAGAIADTLPVFGSGFFFDLENTGVGTITITPASGTIDGAANLAVATNQGVRIATDGTNYFTQRGLGSGGSGSGVTAVDSGCSLAGGTITTTGTLLQATPVNSQVGTTYTFLSTDCGKLVSQSNAGAIADTLPVATTSGFGSGFFMKVENTGAGLVTITPTTSTIDGAATLTLSQNQGVEIASDGTNYFTVRGIGSGSGSPTKTIVPCPPNAVCRGIYITDNNANAWGPIYPVLIPPVASMWATVGNNSGKTLADITGGGLTFSAPVSQLPGGYQIAAAGATWTFTVQIPYSTSGNAGVIGIFCSDILGNAVLFHYGFNATSVSYWTGMLNGGTPGFNSVHANTTIPIMPQFVRMQVTMAGARDFQYSTDGQNWTNYTNDIATTFVTCTNVGIEGYGDGTQETSIGTVVSVMNTTP